MIAAVVPAAGRSERMGRPKLILPIGGTTVIARVVAALREGGAAPVVVVTAPPAAPGAAILAEEAAASGALVVVAAERPADMRGSFELGLARLGEGPRPDAVLLAPADSPALGPGLVARVLAAARAEPRAIVVPTFRGRRGHPIALPWDLAVQARSLPEGAGLNALVAQHPGLVAPLEIDDEGVVTDLDTPDDYRRWAARDGDRTQA